MTQAPFPAVAAAIKQTLEAQGFTRLVGAEAVAEHDAILARPLRQQA